MYMAQTHLSRIYHENQNHVICMSLFHVIYIYSLVFWILSLIVSCV